MPDLTNPVLTHMYPGRDAGIRSGKDAHETRMYYLPTRTPEEMANERLRQLTHDLEELRKDPAYAEEHTTSFPEINAQVALARTRRVRGIVDREEQFEARRLHLTRPRERAREEEEEEEVRGNERSSNASWRAGQWATQFRLYYQ
jgi:hypothetical protein